MDCPCMEEPPMSMKDEAVTRYSGQVSSAPAEGAEQFYYSDKWPGHRHILDSTETALEFAEAYAASLREQLSEQKLNAVDLFDECRRRGGEIEQLSEQLAQAQRERDQAIRKWAESQKIVHYRQFHQWKWELCDKAECKSAREALARTSEEAG